MENNQTDTSHKSLAETLEQVLASEDERGPSIGELTSAVGEKGFGLLLVVLSLPSALPVPAPGYSTPFGIVIGLLAIQMMVGRSTVWLPNKLKGVRINPTIAQKMIGAATKFLKFIEQFIRPRQLWIRSRIGQAGLAIVVLIMACLMMLPIPLTNTFPAMVIFLVGVGLSEEDGLLAMGAFAIGCAAVALYVGIIYIVATQGVEVIDQGKDWIKAQLGMGRE